MNDYSTLTSAVSTAYNNSIRSDSFIPFSAGVTIDNSMAREEKDNKKTIAYNVAGLKIKGDKIFENKTKTTKLHFYGEGTILNVRKFFNETIIVDTDVYNKYDWHVSNGILYVVLYEKINKMPEFNRVEKAKKVVKEEEK